MPLTRITVLQIQQQACSYDHIRILRPLRWRGMRDALWGAGISVDVMLPNNITMQALAATDCLVLHGVPHPGMMNLLRRLPCRFAIFEDDLMRDVPPWNPNKISAAQSRCLDWCLEHACAIVATTQPLADALGYPNKTRTQGNLEDFDKPPEGAADRMKRAMFVGGNSHAADLELLNDLDWWGETVIWSSCLPSAKIAMYRTPIGGMAYRPNDPKFGWIEPIADYETYCTCLRNIAPRFGIGLAPLVSHPFNRCKSLLRFIEASMLGWVSVVSCVQPYSDIPDDCCVKVGRARNNKGWGPWVRYAANHPEIARRAWEWARAEHSYQEKWTSWLDTYRYIAGKL